MLNKLLNYFPDSKSKWMLFLKTSIPIILASLVFSLNGVIDNFMSFTIEGGLDSLSYANTWTTLVSGIITATTIIGSAIFGQYFGSKDLINIRYTLRFRMLFALGIAFLFFLPAIIFPEEMINFISGSFATNQIIDPKIMADASLYLRIISITWIMSAWGFTSAMIMREAGHGNASLISSIISITVNIILNSILIYALNLPLYFLAISTIISQILSTGFNVLFIYFKNKLLITNPLKLFNISKEIYKQVFRRIISFLFLAIGSICVSIRFIFWNIAYPPSSIGNPQFLLSAATFLGIANAIFNVFWSTFESINTNAIIFVSQELGKNDIPKAKDNANRLWGFNMTLAFVLGLTLFSLSFVIPYMNFIAEGYRIQLQNDTSLTPSQIDSAVFYYLDQLKYVIWPLGLYIPVWVWFITRSRCISSGGRTNITSTTNFVMSINQILWISLLSFVMVPQFQIPFPAAYSIFFVFDVLKVITYEIMYHKIKWAKNLTIETKYQN
ncbi:MAG: MATE family efflux transporter [Metamycoplasmataceae bacterium]